MSLKVSAIFKSYKQGSNPIPILQGASADIKDGEIVAIVGPSGSGKSTLLSLLAGLDRPDQGQIRIADTRIDNLTESEMTLFRGRYIGIVFQQFHLLPHLTALENVMVPLEILKQPDIEFRAKKILQELELGHRFDHFPAQLSGGECQRVAIARALVVRPHLLLADEPSGNLDVQTGKLVMDEFFKIVKEHRTTTLVVTHSEELARRCDRILNLNSGTLK
jgi:putative ABC transport system ATP-binding protein